MVSTRSILKWSIPQLQSHIRNESLHTEKVVFTDHVRKRMRERSITNSMVFEALRKGTLRTQPEIDFGRDLKCRMEYQVSGVEIKIVVALCDKNPFLVLITAI